MLWRLLSFLPRFRALHTAVIRLAESAGIHLNPKTIITMRLDQTAMLAVITAATKAVVRVKQVNTALLAQLEPLKRENEQFKLQFQQADTADAQLDDSLTELRDALNALDLPEEDNGTPDLPQQPVPPVQGDPSGSPVVVDAGGGSGADPGNTGNPDDGGNAQTGSGDSSSGSTDGTGAAEETGEGNGGGENSSGNSSSGSGNTSEGNDPSATEDAGSPESGSGSSKSKKKGK